MEKIVVNESTLNNPLNKQVNNESKLYLVGSNIYKILRKDLRLIDRQLVVQKLILTKPDEVCNPEKVIVNEKNEFLGYSMPFLEGYENLDITNISCELRIEYLKKINRIFRRLLRLGLYFHDTHSGNFMINGDSLVLVDSDSASQLCKGDYKYEEFYLYCCCKNLCIFSLSLILGTDINILNHRFGKKEMKKQLLEFNDGALSEIVRFAYSNYKTLPNEFYVDDLVDLINIDKVRGVALTGLSVIKYK